MEPLQGSGLAVIGSYFARIILAVHRECEGGRGVEK